MTIAQNPSPPRRRITRCLLADLELVDRIAAVLAALPGGGRHAGEPQLVGERVGQAELVQGGADAVDLVGSVEVDRSDDGVDQLDEITRIEGDGHSVD